MRITVITMLTCSLVFGAGCKKDGEGDAASHEKTLGSSGIASALKGVPVDHVAQFVHVPATAQAVATFDLGSVWTSAIDHNFGIAPVKKDPAEVRKALARASRTSLGFDITTATTVTAWASLLNPSAEPLVAVHLAGVKGELKGEAVKTHEDVPIVEIFGLTGAMLESGLIIGPVDAVSKSISVAKGTTDALAKSGADEHKALLSLTDPGLMTVTAVVGPLGAFAPPPFNGLKGAAMTMSPAGRFTTVVKGDTALLDLVMSNYEQSLLLMKKELDKVYAEALRESSPALLPLTFAVEKWEDFSSLSKPTRKEDTVTVSADLGPLGGMAVPVMAIAGSVAIPSFVKYERRAKTVEAIDQLDKIYKGSAVYFSRPRVNDMGVRLPCQFPPSTPATPAPVGGVHPCCADGGECQVNVDNWTNETWSALNFQMNYPHLFMYEFASSGTGADAQFTATAYADLDCDGIFSTFERYGYGDGSSTSTECVMKGSAAFYKDKETE